MSILGPRQPFVFNLSRSSYLDNAAFLKAKINNSGVIALGLSPYSRYMDYT